MENNRIIYCLLLLTLFLGACEKPEELWKLPPSGQETLASVNMGATYDNAVFFTLHTGAIETKNIYSWHLGFASGATEHDIILNGGNEVQIHQTNDTSFSITPIVKPKTEWLWDNPNGKIDSTAFSGWYDTLTNTTANKVYLIDLGNKSIVKFKKLKILSVNPTDFVIRYANLDGSQEITMRIPKNTRTNYTYCNLDNNTIIPFEPENQTWDILFTRYRYVYYDMEPITPYYVNGVLINTKHVWIAETKQFSFEEIDLAKANQLLLTQKADEIGFDWKFFDLNGSGKYVVDSKKIFIIKNKDGYLYKLRFIDFYDESGAKGVPKFAYQRL
ncbi:MAG: HmuY family protein [Bacteroidota bacterium]